MTITIHANGAERKRLVNTIAEWLDWPAQYKGAPSFAYEIKVTGGIKQIYLGILPHHIKQRGGK